jgi:hypothetical protein
MKKWIYIIVSFVSLSLIIGSILLYRDLTYLSVVVKNQSVNPISRVEIVLDRNSLFTAREIPAQSVVSDSVKIVGEGSPRLSIFWTESLVENKTLDLYLPNGGSGKLEITVLAPGKFNANWYK